MRSFKNLFSLFGSFKKSKKIKISKTLHKRTKHKKSTKKHTKKRYNIRGGWGEKPMAPMPSNPIVMKGGWGMVVNN